MPKSPHLPMKWTPPQTRALDLAFEGRWSQAEVAEKLAAEFAGDAPKFTVSLRTVKAWIAHPDFQARLEERRADFAASIRDIAYADKGRRILALAEMAESARREYEARPWLREVRPTRDGDITNESFNRDAHGAFREALADIAAELGARKHVTELTGRDGGPVEISDVKAELLARVAAIRERRRAAPGAGDDAGPGD